MSIEILSWNTNSLRKRFNDGYLQWFLDEKPDIFCVQETKATEDQLKETLKGFDDYYTYFASSTKTPGYSGVAIFTRIQPVKVEDSFKDGNYKDEGRILKAEFDEFTLLNIYFPSGAGLAEKLEHKFEFYEHFLDETKLMQTQGNNVIICGDFNIAHHPIDLVNPDQAAKKPGFLPKEQAFLDRLIENGYMDTFRMFNQEGGNYTWWAYGYNSREKNLGMRLDHFFATENLKNKIKSAYIRPEITGSDHCPIGVKIQL
ncbi:MAG: exodeoxyribonuclease III [Methanobacterium sp.]|jgi:exodeoxyribonuclease-3|nr:exodeoxyribonuclease III [Methanobacterium sp.]